MSTAPPTAPASGRSSSIWSLYRAMVGVGAICGLSIVLVFEATRPVIARNRAEALQTAILEVVPDGVTSRAFLATAEGLVPAVEGQAGEGTLLYAAYDDRGELAGLAVEGAGMGYQDVIRLLWGYSPEQEAIVGMVILESRETPGLGDRIALDPVFLANFEQLDVRLDESGERPLNPIVAVKQGEKTEPWQVDGITGATISAVAVADILRESTARWVPVIERNLETLRAEAPPAGAVAQDEEEGGR